MPQDSAPLPSELAEQLSRNSAPYRDPVSRINWDRLSTREYWLPPEVISLHGVPEFMDRPEAERMHLSHYEFLNFIEAGLWLEGMFMERIVRSTFFITRRRDFMNSRVFIRAQNGRPRRARTSTATISWIIACIPRWKYSTSGDFS